MEQLFDPADPTTGRFQARKAETKARALAGALTLWDQIVNGPDDETASDWVSAWAPTRRAGAGVVVALTDAYVDAFLDAHGQVPAGAPLDVDQVLDQVRPGVSDVDLTMRPLKQVRYALAEGSTLPDAIAAGRRRLASIESTDIQQAFRISFRERIAAEPSIRGYRRVLYGPENCALCVIATTQRYRTDRLMPIHPGCDCGVEPLVGPVGRVVDRDRLDEVQELLKREGVAYGDRAALANTTIRVNVADVDDVTEVPHGELGPLLAVRQHRTATPGDLPKWTRASRREFAVGGNRTR